MIITQRSRLDREKLGIREDGGKYSRTDESDACSIIDIDARRLVIGIGLQCKSESGISDLSAARDLCWLLLSQIVAVSHENKVP